MQMQTIKTMPGKASNGSIQAAKKLNLRAKRAMAELKESGEVIVIRRAKRKALPESEKTPSARFHRNANKRVDVIVSKLRSMKAMLNADVYFSTLEERKLVYNLLLASWQDFKEAWKPTLEIETIEREHKAAIKRGVPNIFASLNK